MKNRSFSRHVFRGGAIASFLVIVMIGAILWGVYYVYQNKQERDRAACIEQAEKKKAQQEKVRQENLRIAQQAEARRKEKLERQRKMSEEARRKADEAKKEALKKQQEEEARRKAEEEEARRQAEEDAARKAEQDEGSQEEPDFDALRKSDFPKPFENKMPDLSKFYPKSADKIPMNEDKVIGTWSWESADKYTELTDFPTESSKWKDRSKAAEMVETYQKWRGQDSRIKASPSAKDFPGLPDEGAELVTRTVEIDSSIGGWHSTGLYAPPGAKVTFSFSGSAPKGQLSVRIGCHTDSLMNKKTTQWARLPIIGNSTGVNKGRVHLADPSGGLVYVCLHKRNKRDKTFKVKISGAIPAPLYIMGETTPEQWQEQLAQTKAPWGEIRMPRLVFTMPTKKLKECVKIKEVAELLQKCMALQDWVAGWDDMTDRIRTPMRFVVDRQISVGFGHSGYPAMGYMSWADAVADGSILTEGSWGLWHELGHNHQGAPFAMEGQTEVSVNIFSLVCEVMGVGKKPYVVRGMSPDVMAPNMWTYLTDKTAGYNDAENGTQLFLWGEIMYHFGCESFREVNKAYIKRPYKNDKTSDDEKWNWVMKNFGKVLQKDLTLFFETWKLPINNSTKGQLKKWEHWQPTKNYPGCYLGLDEGETPSE